jgi:hypothetical protein
VQRPAQARELGEEVALPGDPHVGHVEGERRRGGARAGVEVAAARGDDPRAFGQLRDAEGIPVAPPHRAGQRTRGVAQLEVHAHAAGLEAPDLAEDLNAREPAEPVA